MPSPTVRVLIAEDVADDAELEVRELKRAGIRVTHRVVSSEEDFTAALREFAPDMILSDFGMPGFDGMRALAIATEIAPHTPFIFVSGSIGEEHAIRAVKNGAWDYVLKSNLLRLPPAVERALAEAAIKRERQRVEVELDLAEERLREREAALARAQLMAKLSHVITGRDGSFESWSETLPSLIGVQPDQIVTSTRRWLDLVHPDDRALFRETALTARAHGKRADVGYRLRRHDGTWMHVRQVMEPIPGQADARGRMRWFNTLQDVTEQKAAEARIKRLNRVYAVLSGINGLIVRARERDELYRGACRIAVEHGEFRMAWLGIVETQTDGIKAVAWHGDVRDFLDAAPLASQAKGHGMAWQTILEKRAVISNDILKDPRARMKKACEERGINSLVFLPLIVDGEGVGVLALYAAEPGFFDDEEMKLLDELAGDISFALDHIKKAEQLDYLAYYDSLTGLANRTFFQQRLEQYVHEAGRAQRRLAVIVLDIERLRTINDTLGRRGGDALLKQMAARLLGEAGGAGEVARLGADHFAVVIPEVKAEEDLVRIIENLRRRILAQPFSVEDNELRVSAKAGIALFPNDAAGAETLLRNAEAALEKAKASGERHVFYTQQMTERVAEKLTLENKLRQALEKGEFVLHYQPKVDLETRSILGVEALIRWQSPELGLVPPMKFIPLLEETGLILEVGAWALKRAALDHRGWVEQRLKAPRVAVNVSAIQLRQRDFAATLEQAIMERVAPVGVDLEITESVIMEDIQATIEKLKNARALGVKIAIDDFGTGYSSLAYLAKLPVGSLKIDRSFVITMLSDANTMTLVSTIISLAHSLELKVVAEGVDSEEQAQALRLLRCDEMQGYLYSKPLPAEELVALLRSGGAPKG